MMVQRYAASLRYPATSRWRTWSPMTTSTAAWKLSSTSLS
jgi:hypothetical protein